MLRAFKNSSLRSERRRTFVCTDSLRSTGCGGHFRTEGIQEKMKGKAEVLYTKGCDLVDANWPESELIDYPLTDEEQKEIEKLSTKRNRRM